MADIEVTVEDGVLVATLNRPERMNSLSPELTTGLLDAVDRLEIEHLLLEFWGHQAQVEELGHPGAGDVELPGELCAVLVLTGVDGALEAVRQGRA